MNRRHTQWIELPNLSNNAHCALCRITSVELFDFSEVVSDSLPAGLLVGSAGSDQIGVISCGKDVVPIHQLELESDIDCPAGG